MRRNSPQKEDHRAKLSRENLVYLLQKSGQIQYKMGETMTPFGITGQQYNVLRILAGALPEPLPILEIADRLIERTPGITRFIDKLEKRGYLTRRRDEADRRKVFCTITASGLQLLQQMEAPIQVANKNCFAELSEAELERLNYLLRKLCQADLDE